MLSMTRPKARDGNLNDELAEQAMSGQKKGGDGRTAGGGGYSKRGKPRVGTGERLVFDLFKQLPSRLLNGCTSPLSASDTDAGSTIRTQTIAAKA